MHEEHWHLALDHPVRPDSRYGYARPPHPKLLGLIEAQRDGYVATLETCVKYADDFGDIPVLPTTDDESEPYWTCGWLSPLDLAVLYTTVALANPSRYVEVGSGYSTMFVRRAIDDHGLDTDITSIDPEPRADIDRFCDHVLRDPLEATDLGLFDALEAGDVVFIDGSHRCFTNSDVTVALLEVLPNLPPGVHVGIDDIYLPYDYPPAWADRFYSEQYVLAAWMLGGADVELRAPNAFICRDRALMDVGQPLWAPGGPFDGLSRDGNSFWFVTK